MGRCRVGKTFLVRNFYEQNLVFEYAGVHEAGLGEQLHNFSNTLQQAMRFSIPLASPTSWIQAFSFPNDLLKVKVFRGQTKTKKSIFPTMITTYGVLKNNHYSGLIQAEVLMKDLFSR